ncbi:hypothetical protein [Bizionia myxarmorum]|nr:hypothetical protein [Bizionia myxarmorum]
MSNPYIIHSKTSSLPNPKSCVLARSDEGTTWQMPSIHENQFIKIKMHE